MDKFLVSSPTQLSQPFDLGSDTLMYLNNMDLYENHQFPNNSSNSVNNTNIVDTNSTLTGGVGGADTFNDDSTIKNDVVVGMNSFNPTGDINYNNSSISNDSIDELVPVSNNNPNNKQYHSKNLSIDNSSFNPNFPLSSSSSFSSFQHSKNISLDEGNYYNNMSNVNTNINHKSNLSISSQYSINQDPPSNLYYDQNNINTGTNGKLMHSSNSNNTIYSMDSIPPLFSSISNQSLLDSPQSIQQFPNQLTNQTFQKQSPQNLVVSTPARMGRNKSASLSSMNNVYATPLRGNGNLTLSPINLLSSSTNSNQQMNQNQGGNNSKIVKTPRSSKIKHGRSRSRISIDATNNPSILTQAASKSLSLQNLSAHTNSATNSNASSSSSNKNVNTLNSVATNKLNSAYTPSTFISPKVENHRLSNDLDELEAPLKTPGLEFSGGGQYFGNKFNGNNLINNTYFSPINGGDKVASLPGSASTTNLRNSVNNDPLESIINEDQDDDAFKQLRKAKSYSNFMNHNQNQNPSNDFYSSSKLNMIANKRSGLKSFDEDFNSNNESDSQGNTLLSAVDLSSRLNNLSNTNYNGSKNNSNSNFNSISISSNSTPDNNYFNQDSMNNSFVSNTTNTNNNISNNTLPIESNFYPIASNNGSFMNLETRASQSNFQNIDVNKSLSNLNSKLNSSAAVKKPNNFRSSSSIDLLSPQIVNNSATTRPGELRRTASAFTKSYPASIDLASITENNLQKQQQLQHQQQLQQQYLQQQFPQSQNQTQDNSPGLLPSMATFSIAQQQQQQQLMNMQQQINQYPPSAATPNIPSGANNAHSNAGQSIQEVAQSIMSSDLKLPIKVSEKVDNIDPKKRHQCPLCQARFQRPEHVKRHLKSHSSEKPYQCEEPDCGKRFNRKDNLKAHLKKIHHKV